MNQAAFASAGNPFMVDNLVVVCDGTEFCMRWPVESDPSFTASQPLHIKVKPKCFSSYAKSGKLFDNIEMISEETH